MTAELIEIIRTHSRPLEPQPTDLAPRLMPLNGIRAVLFDIYGTLVISGSGDVGTASGAAHAEAIADSFRAVGLAEPGDPAAVMEMYFDTIRDRHDKLRAGGIEYPEVEIREIWTRSVDQLAAASPDGLDVARLAVEFECRTNPVWPMPGAAAIPDSLAAIGCLTGLISNAQFYTPLVLHALFGGDLDELGFQDTLRVFSFQLSRAKPDASLFESAAATLASQGIAPEHTLYIGNDMRNDIWPAVGVGFRTALFAGDRRSLRLREDDERIRDVTPDLILTHWDQLLPCLKTT